MRNRFSWFRFGQVEAPASDVRSATLEPSKVLADAQSHALAAEHALARDDAGSALRNFRDALELDHDNPRYHMGEARALIALGAHADAADSLQLAMAFDPRSVDARLMLVDLLLSTGQAAQALDYAREAVTLGPGNLDALLRLARVQNRSGDSVAAMLSYQAVLDRSPGHPGACVNLGLIWLLQRGEARRAEALMRTALASDPLCHEARANLGLALQDQGRFEEALTLYEDALSRYPFVSEYRWNRALAQLANGNYRDGWADYELRFEREGGRLKRQFPFPDWDGTSLAGRGILVHAEQGLGDEIMFASCLPDLLQTGARVVLECSVRLESLFRRAFPGADVRGRPRNAGAEWLQALDVSCQSAIGSLPARYRRSLSDFPPRHAFLHADGERIARWRGRLAELGPGPRIGLSWRGGTPFTRGELRSVPRDMVARLLDDAGIQWVCLQHAPSSAESALVQKFALIAPDSTGDLEDLAALMVALDGVVSIGNTIAHLAGALGLPTWCLLCTSPDWRWLHSGERTPWYPSLRLLRQASPGDWQSVIERLSRELEPMVAARIDGQHAHHR